MLRLIKILSLLLTSISFLAAIWIVVPAPHYYFWLLSVAVGEWSLWLGSAAVIGIVFALVSRFSDGGKIWIFSLIFGVSALIISVYPYFSALQSAAENNNSLSFKQYFFGGKLDHQAGSTARFSTYTFFDDGANRLQTDVYLPTAETPNNGASIIVVHGGSWRGGQRNDFPQWNEWLAQQGFTVFDVDYRTAPQPNYLTTAGDVKCAVVWVKNHAAEFHAAPDRIALLGRSAGAHLALLTAYSAGDERIRAGCGGQNADEKVRAVVSFYAPTDLLWAFDHPANQRVLDGPRLLSDFVGGNPHESNEIRERFALVSPNAHVNGQTPPTLLIHGGSDQLVRPENMNLTDSLLTAAGISHQTIYISYAQHGFDYNFNGWGSQIVQPVISDFLSSTTGSIR